MISDWQFATLLIFIVGGFVGVYYVMSRVLTLMEILMQNVQWGNPQIRERRPPVPAPAHRKD